MSYASNASLKRHQPQHTASAGHSIDSDWGDDAKPPRDIKKLALIVGLGLLSWVATYVGMLELIEANMGDLPIIHKAIIGFSVAMLMTMIVWLLDQMFAPVPLFTKACYVAGYLFLSIISVGFGFGFYWKVLESRSEASRSAESAVGQVQGALFAASTRLDQLQATLHQLSVLSGEKAALERDKGTSCPNSKPGDGPRRKMRDEDASKFAFASDFVKGRAGAVKGEMGALDGDLAKISGDDKSIIDAKSGTRNEFMKALSRKLDMTVTGFNAFRTDPQLRQMRTDLSDRAEKSTFGDPKSGGFLCPDPQLQAALRGAVRAIDQLPELEKPKIAAVEGSEATIEAFRRLTATFYGLLSFKMPPSADELRELQQKAVQSVEGGAQAQRALQVEAVGLSKRDYVPLAIAIFVDICLLLVSIGRPVNRLNGLVPKMRIAERGPVIQILSRFNDIHRDPQVRQNFEVFRHVVFDAGGVYYVAVPLDAPYRVNPRNDEQRQGYGTSDAQDLQHEAHLLANLFTSFEQERIFSRVYSPFLTTSVIQKKLRRQGSKFAGCQAFRLYRFRDGAWSEIILGAVMGAARRVEADKRRQAEQDALLNLRDPELPAGPRPSERREDRPPVTDRETRDEQPRSRSRFDRPQATTRASSADEPTPSVDPADSARYGPYAAHIARRGRRADAEARARAANSNTMPGSPAAAARDDETVVVLDAVRQKLAGSVAPELVASPASPEPGPAPSHAPAPEAAIELVVHRETATVSIPVTEATLPGGLAALLAKAVHAGAAKDPAPTALVVEAATPSTETVGLLPPPASDEETTPDWTHEDSKFLNRFKHG